MKKTMISISLTTCAIALCTVACIKTQNTVEVTPVEVKPIEVKPIHITLDINLKIEKALDAQFEAIKKSMDERKPKITELKKAGSIGENNKGYLQSMEGATISADDLKIIEQENADRKQIYKNVAKKQDTTEEKAGAIRAKRLQERADSGDYFQKEDGTWFKIEK